MEQTRLSRLRKVMEEQQLEAFFITNAYNRTYMSGFTGSAGYVLITMDRAFLFTDFRYMTQAPQQAKYFEVVEHKANIMESVKAALQELNITKVAFEQDEVTYGTFQKYTEQLGSIQMVPTSQLVEKLRMFKDDSELKVLQEAADLADRAFSHILTKINSGLSEKEVSLELEFFMRKNGATSSSFETIVASGERSALPHGVASDRIIQTNEFVKLDFGAYYHGYCSDITRTVFLGTPTEKHKEIYNVVYEAQMFALEHIKPGMTGVQADALAREVIKQHGYGDYFGHGTGHGLGMEVHEAPRLSPLGEMVLEPGMVVTVEPGIYLPGFGGVRIEDDIVITETGIKILTHSSKDFITL